MGLEPMTSSLPRKCSTTELQQQTGLQAGEGNRTLVFSLEGCCTTIVLHPRFGRRNQLFLQWGLQDSNLCRRSQRIYSPPPLTTRANPQNIRLSFDPSSFTRPVQGDSEELHFLIRLRLSLRQLPFFSINEISRSRRGIPGSVKQPCFPKPRSFLLSSSIVSPRSTPK